MSVLLLCFGCGETAESPAIVQAADECARPTKPLGDVILDDDAGPARADDLEALANVTEITGTLYVYSPYSGPLRLPNLRKLGGLHIEGSAAPQENGQAQITTLELPNLTHIDDEIWVYLAWDLVTLDLRSLESVGNRVFIHRNVELKTLRLDSLSDSPSLEITGNLSLPSCTTESLARFGGSSANGDADTRCHCEMVCDHLEGRCDDVKTP